MEKETFQETRSVSSACLKSCQLPISETNERVGGVLDGGRRPSRFFKRTIDITNIITQFLNIIWWKNWKHVTMALGGTHWMGGKGGEREERNPGENRATAKTDLVRLGVSNSKPNLKQGRRSRRRVRGYLLSFSWTKTIRSTFDQQESVENCRCSVQQYRALWPLVQGFLAVYCTPM